MYRNWICAATMMAIANRQSPIDTKGAKKADLPAIAFNYGQSTAEVVNNGHTIQVNLATGGMYK